VGFPSFFHGNSQFFGKISKTRYGRVLLIVQTFKKPEWEVL
jgi:hypothetical protein